MTIRYILALISLLATTTPLYSQSYSKIEGSVTDHTTKEKLDAIEVSLLNAAGVVIATRVTGLDGVYSFEKGEDGEPIIIAENDYFIEVEGTKLREGRCQYSKAIGEESTVDKSGVVVLERNFELYSINCKCDVNDFPELVFSSCADGEELKANGFDYTMNCILRHMQENPTQVMEILCFSAAFDVEADNIKCAQSLGMHCVKHLMKQGVHARRLRIVNMGSSQVDGAIVTENMPKRSVQFAIKQ